MPVIDCPVIFQVNQIAPLIITNNSLVKNSDWRKEKKRIGKEEKKKALYCAETTTLFAFEFP